MQNKQLYFISILVVLFLISACKSVHPTRAAFGQFCDKSTRCDSQSSLTCQNGKCNCMKTDSMIFDHSRGICVALAGEKCKFTVVEEYRSWLEEVRCVADSRCVDLTGICTCENNFMELSNGSCIPRKQMGEKCTVTDECRSDLHLKCLYGECKCNPEDSIFSYTQGQCVGLADKHCVVDKCTTNAMCRGYYGGHSVDSYEEYSGEDTKCQCLAGYTTSPDGLCQVAYGGECDFLDTQCLSKFKCNDGTCKCPFPSHQVYEEMYQDCYSLVGGPCTTAKNNSVKAIYCIKPAICVPKGNFRFECACPEGMVENEERRCELTHGRICQTQKDRESSTNGIQCDRLAPLFCIQGRCQCEDDLKIYDDQVKKCRGLVGSNCGVEGELNFCVDGAFCQPFRGSTKKGKCECSKYFLETRNRTCVTNNGSNLILPI